MADAEFVAAVRALDHLVRGDLELDFARFAHEAAGTVALGHGAMDLRHALSAVGVERDHYLAYYLFHGSPFV